MGRIAKIIPIPKGDYNATETYNSLDWVRYEKKNWVCKKDGTKGVTPSDGDNWMMILLDGVDGKDGKDGKDGGGAEISDTETTADKTWSSSKIKQEIDNKGFTIDSELSKTSTNPVQNKVITDELSEKIESEVATDFSSADTPEFVESLVDLREDLTATKSQLSESIDEKYGSRGYINTDIDINSCIDNGVYQAIYSNIPTYINYPSKNAGLLLVSNRAYNGVSQILVTNKYEMYFRYRTSSDWSEWKKLALDENTTKKSEEIRYDAVAAIVDVAETYFNIAYDKDDRLVYDSQNGIFTDLYADEEGENYGCKSLVCSQFVQACICAILYKNSRFVLGYEHKNEPLWWGFQSDGTGVYYGVGQPYYQYAMDYMRTSELYNYFDKMGIAHKFDVNHNDMKPGDIIFWLASTFNPSVEGTAEDYMSHCGINLRTYKSKYTFMHSSNGYKRLIDKKEAGVIVQDWTYAKTSPSYYVHLSDIPIQQPKVSSSILASKNFDMSGDIGDSTVYIGTFSFTELLDKGFYTVNIETDGDADGYIRIYYDTTDVEAGITIPNQYKESENIGGISSVVFYAEMPISRIDVRVKNGTHYHVGKVNVYRGYHSPDL